MNTYEIQVGIDVSKATLELSSFDRGKTSAPNTAAGLRWLVARLQETGKIIRMGIPPMRIEVMNHIDGVEFDSCFSRKIVDELDGLRINLIGKEDLQINKEGFSPCFPVTLKIVG